ncbi:WhiB family transcriptional regulator [Streptomyces chartreusis]|uniref:WhiB family transcriptional regulator n=1 Tax=Streptomyces chartreusis TaxID=1969 RepID=UPI0036307ACF
MRDLTWMDSASCAQVDPDLFHTNGPGGKYKDARKVCLACPVQPDCRAYAQALEGTVAHSHRFGLWANQGPHQRANGGAA